MLYNPYIKTEWFAQAPGGKIKFNWFCFEIALEYYECIMKNNQLDTFRKRCGKKKIGELCTYFAMRMKESVLDRLSGKEDATVIDEEYISDFLPTYPRKTHLILQDVACIAWDKVLSVCEVCPVRCVSEKDNPCTFFDSEVV